MCSLFLRLPLFCTSAWFRYELIDCARFRIFCCSKATTFLLSEDVRHARDDMYFTKTSMCYFWWESKRKIILLRQVTILLAKIEKSLFCVFAGTNWESSIFHQYFFVRQKIEIASVVVGYFVNVLFWYFF